MIIFWTFLILILLYMVFEYRFLIPTRAGLPILMYHKLSKTSNDRFTVSADDFEQQLAFLREKGYTTISFRELSKILLAGAPLPQKSVIITFDDGYESQYDIAYPILKQYQMKATFFLPVNFIGKTNSWDKTGEALMGYDKIKEMSGELFEFGLHSYLHEDYSKLTPSQMEADIQNSKKELEQNHCLFVPVLCYPYGSLPKDPEIIVKMKEIFKRNNIEFAARVKSAINQFPIKDVYELRRVDVRGNESFLKFKIKLKKGKAKLF